MKILISLKTFASPSALLSIMVLVLSSHLWAALGDNAASVLSDQSRMKGALHSVDNRSYVLHEITLTSGGKIREYVSPAGAVFAVAWDGQFPPNLQQLLGPYYQQAKTARQAQADQAAQSSGQPSARTRRGPVALQTPGLVMYESGHMRSFHGLAYIPQLIPQGVQLSDIR
jgi:hypothetical protein